MELAGGRYKLGEQLGAGGAATVYRAHDTVLGVDRAIKLLRGGQTSATLRSRMMAEAQAMARLEHPNVLRIYDVVANEEVSFVVMELAPGGSLAERIAHDGPLPPVLALQYGIQILSALAAAHSSGIVHRDVKPHNVLLDEEGTARLADFGIALVADDIRRGTKTGAAMGSLPFMAPEQRMDARSVGPAADLYAVGATLYVLLTGRNPVDLFTAGPDSGRFAGLDPGVVALLRTATAFDLFDRYPDARSMGQDVMALIRDAGQEPLRRPDPSEPTAFPLPSVQLATTERRRTTAVPAAPSSAAVSAAIGYLTDVGGTLDPGTREPAALAGPDRRARVAGGLALLLLMVLALVVWNPWLGGVRQAPPDEPGPIAVMPSGRPPVEDVKLPSPEGTESEADIQPRLGSPAGPPTAAPEPSPGSAAPTAAPQIVAQGPGPIGSWTGSLNGQRASLSLTGSAEQLEGSFDVHANGSVVRTPVKGSYRADSRTLLLVDQLDTDDAGSYRATLDPSERRLEGRFTYRELDRIVPFVLDRP